LANQAQLNLMPQCEEKELFAWTSLIALDIAQPTAMDFFCLSGLFSSLFSLYFIDVIFHRYC
jgi:hypothetical protein